MRIACQGPHGEHKLLVFRQITGQERSTRIAGPVHLIIFSEQQEGENLITLCEVKTKKRKTRRFRRQRDRQNELVTLLNEKEGKFDENQYTVVVRNIEQENYLPAILNILQEARNNGAAGRTFDDYLRVDCMNLRELKEDPIKALQRQAAPTLDAWERKNDLFGPMSNIDTKVSSISIAPYSIFPFPEDLCAALLMNTMALVSTVNVSAILRKIQKRGWEIVKGPAEILAAVTAAGGDPREGALAEIRKGPCTIALPPTIVGRIGLEFLRPRVVLRELDEIFSEGPVPKGERFLSYYPDERRVWR